MGCITSKLRSCLEDDEKENVWSAGHGVLSDCAVYVFNACQSECGCCGMHCACQTFETHRNSYDEDSDGQLFPGNRSSDE